MHRPILDHTGLSGAFDYCAPPDDPHASMADRDSSFMQMLQDVGLKLQSSTGPTKILTIDDAEPPPPTRLRFSSALGRNYVIHIGISANRP